MVANVVTSTNAQLAEMIAAPMVIAKLRSDRIRDIVMLDFKVMALYAMTSTNGLTEAIRVVIVLYV